MNRKAIDVVLLPDDGMMDKAIEANRELVRAYGGKIVLNKDCCLPHISMAMGCIDDKDVPAIENILRQLAEESFLGPLKVVGIHASTSSSGETVSAFEVAKTDALQHLHEEITTELTSYLSYDVSAAMLYNPAEVREPTLEWIRNYRLQSSFTNFFPHITIGYGETGGLSSPIEFTAEKLTLCHLGNHCTCRRVLAATSLERGQSPAK
jgi:2'-5' RNA ligase